MILAGAALPALEVVLEVRVPGSHLRDARQSGVRERCSPEVRVHQHAGRVQDTAQRGPAPARKLLQDGIDERARLPTDADLLASALEHRAGSAEDQVVRLVGEPFGGE
ncbi:hypothetical protein BH20ACT14_BH20ACT14_09330 [soil metagenome]